MPKRLQSYSEKRLTTQLAAPSNTAIGKQITSLIPAGAKRLAHTEDRGTNAVETTDSFDTNGDGKADLRLTTRTFNGVVDDFMLRVTRPGADRQQTYFAPASGRIDSFYDGNRANSTWTRDDDRDGRVDSVVMTGTDMGTFTLEGHTGQPIDDRGQPIALVPGKLPREIASRTFKDTNGDGSFDQESVGGPWWIKDE